MKPLEIRIKIAALRGWTEIKEHLGSAWGIPPEKFNCEAISIIGSQVGDGYYIPDYFNDLNACREFEKSLTEEEQERYAAAIARRIGFDFDYDSWFDLISISPEVRCYAFMDVKFPVKTK
jgi:hypothetical protein